MSNWGSPSERTKLAVVEVRPSAGRHYPLVHLHCPGQPVAAGADQDGAQLVQHGPGAISRARWRACAEIPFFWEANSQQAENQTVSGDRRLSNTVPAVTAVRFAQAAHLYRSSATA